MAASNATLTFDELMAAYLMRDTAYQYTWSKIDVHRTLLNDEVRVKAFKAALEEKVGPDDTVLDIGTGTGILAFLAARAGAKNVVGVDTANIIDVARKTAEKNGFSNVEFVRTDIRDLSMDPVDCIICELIGMYITDEGIIHKVRKALKLLRKGGTVIPESLDIYLVPIESDNAGLGFWRRLYGIDYSAVDKVPHEIRNLDLTGSRFLSEPKKIAHIDLASKERLRIRFDGEFEMKEAGELHGCAMYFDAKLSESVTLSTDPRKPLMHWKQVFMPYEARASVSPGDRLGAKVKAVFDNTTWRYRLGLS